MSFSVNELKDPSGVTSNLTAKERKLLVLTLKRFKSRQYASKSREQTLAKIQFYVEENERLKQYVMELQAEVDRLRFQAGQFVECEGLLNYFGP